MSALGRLNDYYTRSVGDFEKIKDLWNPLRFLTDGSGDMNAWVVDFVSLVAEIGLILLVVMMLFRITNAAMDDLSEVPLSTQIMGLAVEFAIISILVTNYSSMAHVIPKLFFAISQKIYAISEKVLFDQVMDSLSAVQHEKDSEVKFMSASVADSSFPNLIAAACNSFSIALYWIMGMFQGVMVAFFYLVGPLLIPFAIFKPLRGAFTRWLGSFMAYSFMGVVGAIMFAILVQTQFIPKAAAAGFFSRFTISIVFGVLTILAMVSIHKIATSIFEGIGVSLLQNAMMASFAGGMAAKTALAGAGATAAGAGGMAKGGTGVAGMIHRYNSTEGALSGFNRVKDAFQNRGVGAPQALKAADSMAGTIATAGAGLTMSQMPSSVQNAQRSLSKSFGGGGGGGRAVPLAMPPTEQHENIRKAAANLAGPEIASKLDIPSNHRVSLKGNQTPEHGFTNSAAGLMESQGIWERPKQLKEGTKAQHSNLKQAVQAMGGKEAKDEIHIDAGHRVMKQHGESYDEAYLRDAKELMDKQGLTPSGFDFEKFKEKNPHVLTGASNYRAASGRASKGTALSLSDSDARKKIRDEAIRLLGPVKGNQVKIPENYKIIQKPGQSESEAVKGSARALMQRQGFIDKKGQNYIANRGKMTDTKKGRKKKN